MLLPPFSRLGSCFCVLRHAVKRAAMLVTNNWKDMRRHVPKFGDATARVHPRSPQLKSRIAREEPFHHVQHRCRKRFSSPPQSFTPTRRLTLATPMKTFSPTSSRDIAG